MKRIFLDANVLFTAAHNPQGKAALLIESASGRWQLHTSTYAVEEAQRNLLRKFPESIRVFEALIRSIRVMPSSDGAHCPLPLRPKDRPIFQAALVCGATHLLTGDLRDFGPFMNDPAKSCGVVIQTVADFFKGIQGA